MAIVGVKGLILMMCCLVLRQSVSSDDASRVTFKRRENLVNTEELHRCRLSAAVCRQTHHIRL